MAVKIEKDLSHQLRGYWLKAVAAIELRNFGYAIDLLQDLLKHEPEFLTGRQMLRRAEVTRSQDREKRILPSLDRAARGHEGAAGVEKESEKSNRVD